jgi:hypothetical protein
MAKANSKAKVNPSKLVPKYHGQEHVGADSLDAYLFYDSEFEVRILCKLGHVTLFSNMALLNI